MDEERVREQKRVRQACTNCRRKKTRCSGGRPACTFCARLGQTCLYTDDFYQESTTQAYAGPLPLPQENQRLAARISLLESRLNLLDANGGDSAVLVRQQSKTLNTERDTRSPNNIINSGFPSLLDHTILQSLADVYFRLCHRQPYTYFHEPSFRLRLESGSLPSYLIFAFAATAVRFSLEPCFVGRQDEAIDLYSRMAWSEIMEQSFSDDHILSICTVQATNMLGIVDYVAGRNQVAWVKIGLAVRLAQTLQLGKEPDPLLLPSEAEERRHTFWSVYLLDRLVACGRDRPPIFLDVDCTVRLPVNACSFQNPLDAEPPTLAAIQEIPDIPLLEKSDHYALSIFMVSTLGYIARWAFGHSAPETRLPWDSKSEFARINGILLSFESYSDACDGNFVDVLNRHFVFHGVIDEGMSSHFIYSHIIYHLNQCLLHHPFLLRQHLKTFKANVPVGFLRGAMRKSREHAVRLATIICALQECGSEAYPSFYGYAAVIAAVILRLHSADPSCAKRDVVEAHLNSCLCFLEHEPIRWQSYKRMSTTLKDFKPTSLLATDLLSSTLTRTHIEPNVEDALWQICDYSWLAGSGQVAKERSETSSVQATVQDPTVILSSETGQTLDFDMLFDGALSFDYALLDSC